MSNASVQARARNLQAKLSFEVRLSRTSTGRQSNLLQQRKTWLEAQGERSCCKDHPPPTCGSVPEVIGNLGPSTLPAFRPES